MVAIVLAAFFFLDPFNVLPERGVRRPGSDPEMVAGVAEWYESEHRSAEDYVLDRLEGDEVVILGELGRVRQQIEFVTELVPALHTADVHTIAFGRVLAEDQDILDRLLDGSREFDSRTAADLLLRRDVLGGYREYVEFLEAVHTFNAERSDGRRELRVVALAPQFRYDLIETQADSQDWDLLREVVGDTPPGEFMANVFEREIIDSEERALAFVQLPHAFSEYEAPALVEEMERLGFENPRPFGRHVEERTPGTVSTVLLHGPWPDEQRQSNLNYAVDGHVDAVHEEVPDTMRNAGFDLGDNPLGNLPVTVGQYAQYHDSLRLSDLADGYVTLGPIADYRGARVISDFYTEETIEYARRNFPGPTEEDLDPAGLQEFLRGSAQSFGQWINEFQ